MWLDIIGDMKKEFSIHDNIDYEVIQVSKYSLLLNFKDCEKYAGLPAEVLGYGGIALSLLATVFFTESTRNLWKIPGTTIQAAFLVGAIITIIITLKKTILWYKVRDKYTPETIVASLSKNGTEPIVLLPAPLQQPRVVSKNRKQHPKTTVGENDPR